MICKRGFVFLGLLLSLGVSPTITRGQPCNDFDECTNNDMCVADPDAGKICAGTPVAGCPCDDFNDCTTNDRYINGECTGDPVAAGTPCNGGCGNCQTVPVPGFPPFCLPNEEMTGQACSPGIYGPCSVNPTCNFAGFCGGSLRNCPDSDSNPCTPEFCNFETGQCQTFPECPPCETCSPQPGVGCVSVAPGTACDDFNECTAESHCGSIDGFGFFCVEGPPTVSTATPTRTTGAGTATPTATNLPTTSTPTRTGTRPVTTPTPTMQRPTNTPGSPTRTSTPGGVCAGDCNNDTRVAINELVTGVNIALERALLNTCPSFDRNSSNKVEINELIGGVNNALGGCPP